MYLFFFFYIGLLAGFRFFFFIPFLYKSFADVSTVGILLSCLSLVTLFSFLYSPPTLFRFRLFFFLPRLQFGLEVLWGVFIFLFCFVLLMGNVNGYRWDGVGSTGMEYGVTSYFYSYLFFIFYYATL